MNIWIAYITNPRILVASDKDIPKDFPPPEAREAQISTKEFVLEYRYDEEGNRKLFEFNSPRFCISQNGVINTIAKIYMFSDDGVTQFVYEDKEIAKKWESMAHRSIF